MTPIQALLILLVVIATPYLLGYLISLAFPAMYASLSFESRQERLYARSRRLTGGHD